MTARHALVTLAALTTLLPAGCRRASSTAAPGAAAAAAAPLDYRTYTAQELELLIHSKTGSEVTLTPNGTNRYTGQIKSPDGMMLPLEVTVEAERVVCETKTPAGSKRDIITPNAPVKSELYMK
jgi:hypothetical protein